MSETPLTWEARLGRLVAHGASIQDVTGGGEIPRCTIELSDGRSCTGEAESYPEAEAMAVARAEAQLGPTG
jgi:hypothetical protein